MKNYKYLNELTEILQNKFELLGRPITIAPSPADMFSSYEVGAARESEKYSSYRSAEYQSILNVSEYAAQRLSKVLLDGRSHCIGFNWGTSVFEVVKKIQLQKPLSEQQHLVSLFGDLDFYDPSIPLSVIEKTDNANSNNIVMYLQRKLNENAIASVLNVPGYIPHRFAEDPKAFDAIKEFVCSHASYRKIYASLPNRGFRDINGISNRAPEAMLSKLDTIVTSFGSAVEYSLKNNYLTDWSLSPTENEQLKSFADQGFLAGDIGGHVISTEEGQRNPTLNNFLQKINSRLLTVQPIDFIDIAARNFQFARGAGVIGVAVGARKAKIIFTLLSWKAVPLSELFLDSHCALALLNLIDPKSCRDFLEKFKKDLVVDMWAKGSLDLICA